MATKQLVKKRDSFVKIDEELHPFLNKIISKNKEVTDIREEVIRRIASELDKAQARAKARLLGLNYCINTFDAYYKENPLFGGFCLTGGGVPRAYKYKADTTKLEIMWLGNKVYVNAIRSTVYPGGKVKSFCNYSIYDILERLNKTALLDKVYNEYLKKLDIDNRVYIDAGKKRKIVNVLKHKKENIFIVVYRDKGSFDYNIAIFNGKETVIIPITKSIWATLYTKVDKLPLKKFCLWLSEATGSKYNSNLIHDFLNQKIGAEYVQMYSYV